MIVDAGWRDQGVLNVAFNETIIGSYFEVPVPNVGKYPVRGR
jgi:hypothetical protein